MLSARIVVVACLSIDALACRDARDPGFDLVKVPLSAYAAFDASAKHEGGVATTDAGADPLVLCLPKSETEAKEDEETNSDDCPNEYRGRAYDEKATARHRSKGDDSSVCCYRKGHAPHRIRVDEE